MLRNRTRRCASAKRARFVNEALTSLGGRSLRAVIGDSGSRAWRRLVDDCRAARANREAKLVERKRKRHTNRFVELLVLRLVNDSNYQIVSVDLETVDDVECLRGVSLADQIEHALQQSQPARPAVAEQVAGDAGDRRAEHREYQHAVENVVAILVEKALLIVIQIIERARMRQDVGILVG